MPNYRRARVEGASYFFTVALADRGSDLLVREVDALRAAYLFVQRRYPFACNAFVVLPDHLHAVWTLPTGDSNFPKRWQVLKAQFTRSVRIRRPCSMSKMRKREARIWQRRYWEHMIRDEADFAAHVEYCWMNPVKHGLAAQPSAWPYSSFQRDWRRGFVPEGWMAGRSAGAGGVVDPYDA